MLGKFEGGKVMLAGRTKIEMDRFTIVLHGIFYEGKGLYANGCCDTQLTKCKYKYYYGYLHCYVYPLQRIINALVPLLREEGKSGAAEPGVSPPGSGSDLREKSDPTFTLVFFENC